MDGRSSLRLTSPTTGSTPIPEGRYYGTSSAVRVVPGEDWSAWNRLSFWVYPKLKGFHNVSMIVIFHNDGKSKVPDIYGKMGVNYVLLKNGQWNHVVWEIANLPRDKVTGIEFAYRVQGHEPGAAEVAQYDIDKIELQKVHADDFEGWAVAPGRISFSHPGYQTGSPKSALASDLTAKTFDLIDTRTHKVVLTKAVRTVHSSIGRFQVMDFTEVTRPGTYIVQAGGRRTKPFRIGDDVWESSLWKTINFFYSERCGYAVPGEHGVCHADWVMTHNGKQIVVNGGWHDAGDLSQNLENTTEADYAMFTLADRLQKRNENPALRSRLVEEATWGLNFVLKTTFHDGYRTEFNTMDRWTDGIIGTADDMVALPDKNESVDLTCASTEAIAARVLAKSQPDLAARSLAQAQEDWKFGVDAVDNPPTPPSWVRDNPVSRFWDESRCELLAHAAIASLELWKSTGNRRYADKAIAYGNDVLQCQQHNFVPGLYQPITGYFCTDVDKKDVLRYAHLSHEEAPEFALSALCEAFPQERDWIKWYGGVTLYAKYYEEAMARFSEPYGMLGSSLYRDDEYLQVPDGILKVPKESYRQQVLNGARVGDHYYVRRFPVWFEFRGNHGTTLSQAVGLAEAAHVRGDYGLESLLQKELEWVIGRNPFDESTMWGEGYDYAPQYTAMSGNMVGSLPVGIQTHGDADAPYWPTENCHNWKEVWVVPTGRWIWLMKNLSGDAAVEGNAASSEIAFTNLSVGDTVRAHRDSHTGKFRANLPEGDYEVTCGGEVRHVTLLAGGTYNLDLRPSHGVDLQVTETTRVDGTVTVRAELRGWGTHRLTLQADNADFDTPVHSVTLNGKHKTVVWTGKLANVDAPWVGVVTVDGRVDSRKEVSGDAFRSGASR